jgi:L-aminopeptidase/D-esterase-like protein/predicted amidohydrolase
MLRSKLIALLFLTPFVQVQALTQNQDACPFHVSLLLRESRELPTENVNVTIRGVQVASLEDPTKSTGATMFYFPQGAHVAVDARGGSVASSETTLFNPGSYSNQIDSIVFAGGSTMGLEAGDGVRRAIFRARSGGASAFDAIASVPTAVVYDFGGRTAPGSDALIFPGVEMGERLYATRGSTFKMGRAGAGVTTTANKIAEGDGTFWGGQGMAIKQTPHGKVMAAVALNAVGNIHVNERPFTEVVGEANHVAAAARARTNTTLSIITVETPMDRNQLQRLAVMVHTNMAESIRPFHTYWDGDIHFATTTGGDRKVLTEEQEFELAQAATEAMREAIGNSVRTANRPTGAALPRVTRANLSRTARAAMEPRDSLRVAAVQFPIEGGKTRAQFLSKVESYIRRAAEGGSELVLFPELFVWDMVRYGPGAGTEAEQLARIARDDTDAIFSRIEELSRELGVFVVGGSSPRVTEKGTVNTALLVYPDGTKILQDKVFLTADEISYGWVNGDEIKVFDAPWGRSTLLICYDSEFPKISNELARYAPEVFFVPSMTSAHGLRRVRSTTKARAVEHHAFVVETGTVQRAGYHNGQAAFFTPEDEGWPGILAEGRVNEDQIVTGTLDFAQLRRSRETTSTWPGRDQTQRTPPPEEPAAPAAP